MLVWNRVWRMVYRAGVSAIFRLMLSSIKGSYEIRHRDMAMGCVGITGPIGYRPYYCQSSWLGSLKRVLRWWRGLCLECGHTMNLHVPQQVCPVCWEGPWK